jgi:hypothetical protein
MELKDVSIKQLINELHYRVLVDCVDKRNSYVLIRIIRDLEFVLSDVNYQYRDLTHDLEDPNRQI